MAYDRDQGDRFLTGRMLSGRQEAFDTFFETYFPRLFRFALTRLAGDADAAEEVVQAALCRALTKLATYRGEASLFTWLVAFCRREIAAWRRTYKMGTTVPLLVEDAPELRAALESLDNGAGDPELALNKKETARLVHLTLDYLAPRFGLVLEWKYLQGLPVKAIASRLGVSAKAAESLLARARQAFRDGFAAVARGGLENVVAGRQS